MRRRRGWELWLLGMNTPDGKKICPFRLFTGKTVPQSIYKKIKLEWQPILRKMENTPGMPLLDDVNQETVDSTFMLATDYLKDNICSFLFKDDKKRIETWMLGTWSKCTQYSHIKKYGTDNDISNLPNETIRNKAHVAKRTVNKRSKDAAVEDTNSNEEHQPLPPAASPPKPSVSEVVEISPPQAPVAPAKPPLRTRPSKLPPL